MPNDVRISTANRRAYLTSNTPYGKFWILKTFAGSYEIENGKYAVHAFDIEHLTDIILKIKEDPRITYDDY